MQEINELAFDVHQENKKKGFWKERLEIPAKMQAFGLFSREEIEFVKGAILSQQLMLIVTELAEAQEALRINKHAELDYFRSELEHSDETPEAYRKAFERTVKNTFEDEIADSVIRLMDVAGGQGFDIAQHIALKRYYNSLRPYKHGKNS